MSNVNVIWGLNKDEKKYLCLENSMFAGYIGS